ncbi:MAG: cell division ATP-binding protein FtsE [Alphaproteobacteria bacterium]
MIRFENVGLRYGSGDEVLCDVNLTLERGSFHFLTGASGAGKSSLMKLLYLDHRPSRGQMTLLGEDVTQLDRQKLPPIRRKIGVVFQDFRLIEHLNIYENVALPLKVRGMKQTDYDSNIRELLNWVGLGDRLDDLPDTLSGGESQRAAIARAVVGQPSLLLADEPTGNVDPAMGLRLLTLFNALHQNGTTIVVATHDLGLVERFNHPVLHIDEGRVSQLTPAQVVALAQFDEDDDIAPPLLDLPVDPDEMI